MKKTLLFLILFINFSCLAYDEFFVEENTFQNVVIAYKEGNCKKAYNIWWNRGNAGIFDWFDADIDSQYELGNYYFDGICVNKDYKKALSWFKKAAEQEHREAQNNYGLMYYYAYGVNQDNKKAFSWIMKSAEQDYDQAQFMIGSMYYKGEGVAEDKKEAVSWIRKAYLQGNSDATAWFKEVELKAQESIESADIPNLDYGNYHALVIGNDKYKHLKPLSNAVNDANAIATLLRSKYQFNVNVLTNATRDEIVSALSKLPKTVSAKDNILIYYAGHGYLDKDMDEGFWLPIDAVEDDQVHWVANDTIMRSVRAMKAKHVMVVADSCFSGTLTRGIKVINKSPDYIKEIVKKKARTVLTSGGLEPVSDVGGGNNSVFAASFLRILNENSGVMNGSELFIKIRKQVMQNTKDQTPEYGDIRKAGHDGGDFLFVRQ